jgi:hypothetical protein
MTGSRWRCSKTRITIIDRSGASAARSFDRLNVGVQFAARIDHRRLTGTARVFYQAERNHRDLDRSGAHPAALVADTLAGTIVSRGGKRVGQQQSAHNEDRSSHGNLLDFDAEALASNVPEEINRSEDAYQVVASGKAPCAGRTHRARLLFEDRLNQRVRCGDQ